MRWWTIWVSNSVLACAVWSAPALGAVTQPAPDSTPLPQPVPVSELSLATSRGFAADAGTLAGLFAARGQTLDPTADALASPGTFTPRCGGTPVTAEFVLSGGSCHMDLAWYNATEGVAPGELHTLIPADIAAMACDSTDFCPQATPSSYVGQFDWTPYVYSADVCNDPAYTGGAIGFALVGAGSVCTATKYSQYSANVVCSVCSAPVPWVTALIYRAQIADTFFLAFEDLPMTPENWKASGGVYVADGDFNDFVFQLGGVCHGTCDSNPGSGGSGGGANGGSSNGGSDPGSGGSSQTSGGSSQTSGGSSQSSGGSSQSSGGSAQSSGGSAQSSGGSISFAGAPPSGACTPGSSIACLCPNNTQGAFLCPADGSAYSGCLCSAEDKGCGCSVPESRSELASWLAALALAVGAARRAAKGQRKV